MVVMGVEHYGQPPVFTFILELCNALFTTMFALGNRPFTRPSASACLFTKTQNDVSNQLCVDFFFFLTFLFPQKQTEAVVKMIGLRHHYFTLPWNLFDLTLVSASVVGLIMEDVLNEFPISPTLLRVVRVFRLGRVLRLVKVTTTTTTASIERNRRCPPFSCRRFSIVIIYTPSFVVFCCFLVLLRVIWGLVV